MIKQKENNSGVYQILNITNSHRYIGSSAKGVVGRLQSHYKSMNNGGGSNIILKRAVKKYGIDNFKFEILLYCDPENCILQEQMVMDKFKPEYNICQIAGSTLGMKFSEESKRKISDALCGKKLSEEHKRNIGDAHRGHTYNLGKKHSAETKRKIGDASRGRQSPMLGRKLSEEHKKKIGVGNHGKILSDKTKRKMSEAQRGNTNSLGHRHSDASKLKMSKARNKYLKRRKMNGTVKQ